MPGFRESLGNALFGIDKKINEVKKAAYSQGYSSARDAESNYVPLRVFDEAYRESYRYAREADKGFQPISQISGSKDLMPLEFDDLQKAVYKLYTTSPLAKEMVDLVVNFIVGEDLNVVCDDEKVQEVIDEFWEDEHNDMEFRSENILSELILFGEQYIVCFPNFENGTLQITQIDPIDVTAIATDKDNKEKEVLIILKNLNPANNVNKAYVAWDVIPYEDKSKIATLSKGMKTDDFKIFLPDEFDVGETKKKLNDYEIAEDAFILHFKINAVTGSRRGWPDLATNANWIAIFDEALLNTMRLRRFRTAWIYDVTLKTSDKATIAAKNDEIAKNPPKPGTVMVHGDNETWATQQPNIDSKDTAEDLHQVLMHVGRPGSIPEHYLGSGGDVNRASASEMGLPTIKYMKRRQRYFGAILKKLINIVIDVSLFGTAGIIQKSNNLDFKVEFPDIDSKDNLSIAQAVTALVTSLVAAKDSGWISDKTAQRLLFKYLGEENTPGEEDELIGKEKEKKPVDDKKIVTKDYEDINVSEALSV